MDNDAPKPYQAGTWGPVASVAMITRDGRSGMSLSNICAYPLWLFYR